MTSDAGGLDRELKEQPDAIARLLDNELPHASRFERIIRDSDIRYVVIAARGSSDNAARYAQYLFGARLGLPVALATPSIITLYDRRPLLDGALVIGVSQSGRSPDVAGVVEEARRQGRPTIAITNDASSPLANAASEVLTLHAGSEKSIAATKTYLCSLAAIALVCAAAGKADRHQMETELRTIPEMVDEVLRHSLETIEVSELQAAMDRYAVVGRGYNYCTAFEIALKMKELSGVAAEPYSPPDLLHGPIAAIDELFPVVLVGPSDATLDGIRELATALALRGAELIAISRDERLLAAATSSLLLAVEPTDWLTPFVTVVPGQVFAIRLARARGADPDRPRGLSKVTETY